MKSYRVLRYRFDGYKVEKRNGKGGKREHTTGTWGVLGSKRLNSKGL